MFANQVSRSFHRNRNIIRAQAEGLTHEDSLRQTEYNVNCFNWVVGHIVSSRRGVLRVLDVEPPVTEEQVERYLRESDPIRDDGPGVVELETLLAWLDETEELLEERLASVDEAYLAEEVPAGETRMAPRGAQVMFGLFHDTYHTGQTDLLRQMSGKSDKII